MSAAEVIDPMYNKENLAKIKKMDSLAPEVMTAFWAFDKAAVADGAIPVTCPTEERLERRWLSRRVTEGILKW